MFHWTSCFSTNVKQLWKNWSHKKKLLQLQKIQMTNYIIGLYPFFDFLYVRMKVMWFSAHWSQYDCSTILVKVLASDWKHCPLFLTKPQASNVGFFAIPLRKKVAPTSKSWIDRSFFVLGFLYYEYFDIFCISCTIDALKWRFCRVCLWIVYWASYVSLVVLLVFQIQRKATLKKLIPQKKVAPTSKNSNDQHSLFWIISHIFEIINFMSDHENHDGLKCTLRQYIAPYRWLVMLSSFFN